MARSRAFSAATSSVAISQKTLFAQHGTPVGTPLNIFLLRLATSTPALLYQPSAEQYRLSGCQVAFGMPDHLQRHRWLP